VLYVLEEHGVTAEPLSEGDRALQDAITVAKADVARRQSQSE
jgi:hypothetical protein